MIERFNFYDVYGYLIPGAVWLGLIAIPLALAGGVHHLSATEVTVGGLIGGYVGGHFLSGMARKLFPSRKYENAANEEKQLSDLLLDDEYKGEHALAPAVWGPLQGHVEKRFGINIFIPDQRKGVFFLCRTALAQGKVGSYVEQYQGLLSLTRALAAACIFAVVFYAGWVVAVCFPPARAIWNWVFSGCLPVLVAVIPILLILLLDKDSKWFWKHWKTTSTKKTAAGNNGKQNPPKDWMNYVYKNAESIVFAALLLAIGFVADGWFPLTMPQAYQLAALSSILLIALRRFLLATHSFDASFATAVFRDFIVLSTAKSTTPTAGGGS